MKWPSRASFPVPSGKLNLMVMCGAFTVFGFSLLLQPRRWGATPAYHVLLQIFPAQAWGGLFLASGISLGLAAWQYGRQRWAVTAALMLALALTAGWMLAFCARYLSNPDTTPETWVSWAVFGFLLVRAAAGLDQPHVPRPRELPEVRAYRQAVEDALDDSAARLRASVAGACDAYGAALAAVVPAGAMPAGGDLAGLAIAEARNALLRAEEAYERATGKPARPPDPP